MPLEVAQYYGCDACVGTHVKARDMGAAKALWCVLQSRFTGTKELASRAPRVGAPTLRFSRTAHRKGHERRASRRRFGGESCHIRGHAGRRSGPERLEKLSKAEEQAGAGTVPEARPRIDARGAPWFNALFPGRDIELGWRQRRIMPAPDIVSRAHAAVEAVVSGFAVAMRDMAKRSAADNSSSGGSDSSISSSSNNGGNNGNGKRNAGTAATIESAALRQP